MLIVQSDTGLTENNLTALKNVFAKFPAIEQVKLYGSRAKGTYNPRSDIDLVAFGQKLDRYIIAEVLMDLDDSDIPYQIDFQNYHALKNPQLIEHINRVGKVIYMFDRSGKYMQT